MAGIVSNAEDYLYSSAKTYADLESVLDVIQVRNSVISHWLQEKNIREVQYLAGHGSIKSTQRYAQGNLQELTEQLNKYHPLK